MMIQQDKVVTMHYHLTSANGEVLDSTHESDPLMYLHGTGTMLPSLESALVGLQVGATKTVHLAPADAYGERDADMVQTLPRDAFEEVDSLAVGMQVEAEDPNGQTLTVSVVAIREDGVDIDGNHPLAGEALTFAIEIVDVRDATTEELAHGHIHGEGGHHH